MKAQLTTLALAILILNTAWISPVSPPKQEGNTAVNVKALNPEFSFFRTHRQAKNTVATWALTSTQGVMGFSVQRTYQDPSDPYSMWEEICTMACTPTRSFKHTDNTVFPGYIHYRVVAYMDNGSSVVSEISTVRIVAK